MNRATAGIPKMCEQCGGNAVAYEGARFCGGSCTARHEAHQPPALAAIAIADLESELREAKAATESAEDALTIATERYDRELLTLEGSTVRLHWARAEDLLAKERDAHAKTKAELNNIKNLFESGRRESGHLYTTLAAEQAAHKKTRELADALADAACKHVNLPDDGSARTSLVRATRAVLVHRAECEGKT